MHLLGLFFKSMKLNGEKVFVWKKLANIQFENRLALMEVEILL
jgi:hypothetical protein